MLYSITERLRLSKRAAFWAIMGCIWLYTLFVGASPTVIRAAVMGTIVVLGQRLERRAHAWTTIFAACWAMTLYDPQTLWDLGFQLSALATASLFAYGKGTEALLLKTPLRVGWLDWAREALTATLAAQILALPLILYHFGNLSIIAPLANVILLPMVPYVIPDKNVCSKQISSLLDNIICFYGRSLNRDRSKFRNRSRNRCRVAKIALI
jgi:competence protein ComEC